MFTIDIKTLSSYELGKSPLGTLPEPIVEDVNPMESTNITNQVEFHTLKEEVAKVNIKLVNNI